MPKLRYPAGPAPGLSAIAVVLLGLGVSACGEKTDNSAPSFTGSAECRECHEGFYSKWATSFHGLAMRPFSETLVREQLTPSSGPIAVGTRTFSVVTSSVGTFVREQGPGGDHSYPIAQVMGGKNVFYLLTTWRGGRLQVLPLAFDVRQKEWYDTTGSMVRHLQETPDAPVNWTDRLLTFNGSCYTCHVSQLSKNYSVEKDEYETVWAEPGINCEACHGPGGKHIEVMRRAKGRKVKDLEILVIRNFTSDRINSLCGACHAKMSPLNPSFKPGGRFFDDYHLFALEDRDFYPDGRDLGENFTYTLWLLSGCVKSGKLDCMHCHTSSGRNKFPGEKADEACLPCHSDYVRNPAEHSHHKAESAGSRCVSCHMPETSFARMRRHDHSMLAPTPATTLKFESPNACNLCHTDRDAKWADRWVRKWYPRDYQAPILHRASLVDAARKEDWSRLPQMVEYVTQAGADEVFAASLLRLMERCPDPRKWPAYRSAAASGSALVRAAAVTDLAASTDARDVATVAEATGDDFRLVRVRAAAALAGRSLDSLGPKTRARVQSATKEYEESLKCLPDDPRSRYNLGNFYQSRGDLDAAKKEYEIAIRQLPSFVPALVNVSMVHARMGDTARAEQSLRAALRHDPQSAEAHFNLGLLLAELQRPAEAEQSLRAALAGDHRFPQAAYNLGVLLADRNPQEALAWSRKAHEWSPADPKYAYTLAFYLERGGDRAGAIRVLEPIVVRNRGFSDSIALLATLYEQTGSSRRAIELYRSASSWPELDELTRQRFASLASGAIR